MLKVAFSPIYRYELPQSHRFPMIKYDLLAQQLIYEGCLEEENFFHPQPIAEEWILRTHSKDYWDSLKEQTISAKAARKIGFPMSDKLVQRSKVIAQGTIDCCLAAQEYGVSLNIAGGTHHAYASHGEGFCLLNDFAIAANYLLDQGLAQQILIVDLDVHQGNGSAKIFENEPRVFTFSMHAAANYPFRKERSDLDIALPDLMDDGPYLQVLADYLPALLESLRPDMVLYLSGVDVLASDKLGRLGLSLNACAQRDQFVFSCCQKAGVPVAVSMGGGYSPQLRYIIEAHANTYRMAQKIYS